MEERLELLLSSLRIGHITLKNMEGGRTIDETVEMAKALERMGAAAIDLSCAVSNSYFFSIVPGTLPGMKGLQKENAKAIKAEVNIPVIVAGGIRDPYTAEEFFSDGGREVRIKRVRK